MWGVYGGFLQAFPELMESIDVYTQQPLETAGYKNKKPVGMFRVVFQADKADGMTGPAGRLSYHSQWRTIDISDGESMWSVQRIPLGAFFKHPQTEDNAVYRIVALYRFNKEGGYYEYIIQRVTGDTGEQEGRLKFKKGVY